ncbi:MAG: 3-isopropylmalate dehydratase small subunit [Martelella sp.]|uniref:3-isopropylmalate dehydratase small subunit n=1 Tax=unclassified Martelella TaxID=2629616 RepID=UPI000C5CB3DA|nr:3-isopropylmalate dehydratase small subunit [Martelella sp.]MAU21624.1 3-isopropylmalate dehydratase small subunit [Martelella sp.]|tara:strand:+ start:267 stop:950 length:684 start_codon:yes stop_codon:yes gene_type:complete
MQPFTVETGVIASIPTPNIDTDVIMPKQFLKGIDRKGLARGIFYDLRSSPETYPDFALNRPATASPKFLVTGPNFGCGSSREHAVWGLMQFGIRAIIGTTFGGIFADNADNNGLLLIVCTPDDVDRLHEVASQSACEITIDLECQTIALADRVIPFEIGAERKAAMLAGEDAIGRTEAILNDLDAFETRYFAERPWLVEHNPSAENPSVRKPISISAASKVHSRPQD